MEEHLRDLESRLKGRVPNFQQDIQEITGTPFLAAWVQHHGRTVLKRAANLHGAQVISGTKHSVNIGSCSKLVVACAVGILVGRKVVSWDDPLWKLIPELFPQDSKDGTDAGITLRQLLCHQSGIPEYLTSLVSFSGLPRYNLRGDDDTDGRNRFLQLMKNIINIHSKASDKKYLYSNTAFCLVALAIEKATNDTFETFISENIFGPLNMKGSFVRAANSRAIIETGYVYDGGVESIPVPRVDYAGSPICAALGLWSSAEDMGIFFQEVLKGLQGSAGCILRELGEIFPEPDRVGQYELQTETGERSYYAAGVGLIDASCSYMRQLSPNYRYSRDASGGEESIATLKKSLGVAENDHRWVYYHAGTTRGYTSVFYLHLKTQTIIIVLGNGTGQGHASDWMGEFLLQQVFSLESSPQSSSTVANLARKEALKLAKVQRDMIENVRALSDIFDAANSVDKSEDYLGEYHSSTWLLTVRITRSNSGPLCVEINGDGEHKLLKACGTDVYTSVPSTYSGLLTEFTLDFQFLKQFLFRFDRNNGRIRGLFWNFTEDDSDLSNGETVTSYKLGKNDVYFERVP